MRNDPFSAFDRIDLVVYRRYRGSVWVCGARTKPEFNLRRSHQVIRTPGNENSISDSRAASDEAVSLSASPEVVLSIQAHPDDTDFFAGGTVAKLTKQGSKVVYLTVTNGSMGTANPDLKPEDLTEVRRKEQMRAAKVLGVEDVVFLNYNDSELYPSLELRGKLIRMIRQLKPNTVMTLDPWKPYEAHPDHRCTGMMAYEASAFCLLPHVNPEHLKEGLEPHLVEEVHFFDTQNPNHWEDISETIDLKMQGLAQHESQSGTEMATASREGDSKAGSAIGVAYAEAFHVVTRSFPSLFEDASGSR